MNSAPASREYDPRLPPVSIHIATCAGSSFRDVLQLWFADRLQSRDAPA